MSVDLSVQGLLIIDWRREEVKTKIEGCLLDPRGMLVTMSFNDNYNRQRKMAGTQNKHDKIIVFNLYSEICAYIYMWRSGLVARLR